MSQGYLLGIDVGTTNVKAVLLDDEARLLATAVKEYPTYYPHVGFAEQNPEDWWRCFKEVLPIACAQANIRPDEIVGISVSCQSPTLIPMDNNGTALYPALIWMDRRSDPQCARLRETIGEARIFELTGDLVDPYYILPEAMWLRENAPDVYRRTRIFLQANGYINFKLTGEYSADESNASLSGLYDYRSGTWCRELLEHPAVELDVSMFPTPVPDGAVVGRVNRQAAAETGLAEGTLVVAGTVDSAGAAVECGSIRAGDACEMTGTSSVLLTVSDEPHTARGLTYMRHQVPGKHILLGAMSTTGGAYKWCRDVFDMGYDEMNACIAEACPAPSGLIFLPYLSGERAPVWSTEAKGTWIGMTMDTNRARLLRSVLEGTAFALRHNMDAIRASGCDIRTLSCSGGHTHSRLWLEIKASVTGLPIAVPKADSGAPWGAAVLAGIAAGMFASTEELLSTAMKTRLIVEPNPAWQSYYDEQYALYLKAWPGVREVCCGLHTLQGREG